jgi:hypothetical protein
LIIRVDSNPTLFLETKGQLAIINAYAFRILAVLIPSLLHQLHQLWEVGSSIASDWIPSWCRIPPRSNNEWGRKPRVDVLACAARRTTIHNISETSVAFAVDPGVEEAQRAFAVRKANAVQICDDGGEGWGGSTDEDVELE